jgi:hypothetical protein
MSGVLGHFECEVDDSVAGCCSKNDTEQGQIVGIGDGCLASRVVMFKLSPGIKITKRDSSDRDQKSMPVLRYSEDSGYVMRPH